MLEGGKINTRQAAYLLIFTIMPTAILFVPAITTKAAGQDGWLSVVVATVFGLLAGGLILALSLRFPGKNLYEFVQVLLGKILGKVIILGYIWYFFHAGAAIIREYGEFLTTAIMPETPLMAFNAIIVLVAVYAVRSGLEVLARIADFIFPLVAGAIGLVVILPLKEIDFSRFLPILENGIKPVIKGAIVPSSWYGEVVIMAVFLAYLNQPEEGKKVVVWGTLVNGLSLLVVVIGAMLVFGAVEAAKLMFPMFSMARMISIGEFLEGVESLVMAIWVAGVFLKIAIYYYVGVLGIGYLFGLKDYRPAVIPYGVAMVMLSVVSYESIMDLVEFLDKIWPPYALSIFQIGLPVILLVVSYLKAGKEEKIS
ncbi:GerAB/ArcD/ProY family transporter [Calderihabitans maritimus]|uniref:Spore germination protein n=1 Tax=Calderihabitans maritimus TaxID=1246530 RepID=A0A1Z5HSB8_9FIRM|nr:endospore germination permease [Calderihabitans maritimus]GAW92419.1 spore germination protein [Calderihabitans maritimus]